MAASERSSDGAAIRRPAAQLAVRLDSGSATARAFRIEVDTWLTGLRWPDADREDVVLAVSEACTNALEHAYPGGEVGPVEVTGSLHVGSRLRHVVMLVRDRGTWRPPPDDPGPRGHGFAVMRGCMDRVDVRPGPHGTTIAMTSCAVPLVDAPNPVSPMHRPAAAAIRLPATDRADGERRHRHHLIARRAAQLRADSRARVDNATGVRERARRTISQSGELVAEATRLATGSGPVA